MNLRRHHGNGYAKNSIDPNMYLNRNSYFVIQACKFGIVTCVDAGGQAAAVQRARGHGRGPAARRGLGGQRGHEVLQAVGVRQRAPAARRAPRAPRQPRRRLARLLVLLHLLQELLRTTARMQRLNHF